MLSEKFTLNKSNIDFFLKELSKEIKKEYGRHANVELLIAGGAAIMMNYSFRDSTTDIDAIVSSQMSIKDAINRVGDKYDLPNGWLNSDFKQTTSYSPKIVAHSKFYKTFNQVLNVRIIEPEYLIAMKLKSNRQYKYDVSDIVGIIKEQKNLSFEKIINAAKEFYGNDDFISKETRHILNEALENKTNDFYEKIRKEEENNKNKLIKFEKEYQDVLTADNVEDILNSLNKKDLENSTKENNQHEINENTRDINDIIAEAQKKAQELSYNNSNKHNLYENEYER